MTTNRMVGPMKPFVWMLLCALMGLATASPVSALTLAPDTGAPEGEAPGQEAEKIRVKDKDAPAESRTEMYQQDGASGPHGAGEGVKPPAAGTGAEAPKKPVKGITGILRDTLLKAVEEEAGKHVETHGLEEKELPEGAEKKKIEAAGQKTTLGSTTDENGNTTTVSKTDNGVWITETTDQDGNPVSTQQKIDLPGGGHRAETVNHQTGSVTRTVVNGDGSATSVETNTRSNTTTTTQTNADRSIFRETKDSTTGETLNEAGLTPDGRPLIYQTGKYADEAFKAGETVAGSRAVSSRDWKQDAESYMRIRRQQEELDRQLISQMQGGEQVKGNDVIVSSQFSSRSSSRGDQDSVEQTQSDYEIKQVDPNGAYEVSPFGNPVDAEQWGDTPSEALANAIEAVSYQMRQHVQSEFIDHTRSTDSSVEENVQENLESSSFAVLKDYAVESVGRTADGQYVVKIKARAGVTQKR